MANVCKKCGNNLYGNKTKCPFCGEPIRSSGYSSNNMNSNNVYNLKSNTNNNSNSQQTSRENNYTQQNSNGDSGGAGWGLLGFCIPLVGIVLYFVFRDEKPYTAKACLNGALISIALTVFINMVAACASGF